MEEQRSRRIQRIVEGLLPRTMDPKDRASETDLLLQFCLSLSKIYPKHKDLYNWVDVDQRVYVPFNMSYLQESFGYIRWGTLLNATLGAATADLYNHSRNRDRGAAHGYEDQLVYVYVTAPRYFRSLGKLLNRFSRRIIHNGLLLLYATDTLHDIVNVTGSKNWELSCFKLTKDVFGEVMGALYVRQYTPQYLETLANRVGGLFERVKETVAERILVKSWLDEETRTQALLKLNSLRGRFHVWPGFYNESLLAREMAEVEIDPEDFFRTVLKRFRQIRTVDDKVLRRNVTEKRRHPYGVTAYYESSTNTIGIPLAMMTAWSWSWDGGPAYAAHATLGSVIGHEILHAFDLHRRRLPLDPDMSVDQWLWITPESWKRLEARIECVARLYARSFWRKVQFYGNDVAVQFFSFFQFDWNVTRNENVADIGALQISYKTWHTLTNGKDRSLPGLEGLRSSQLFFISAAQMTLASYPRMSAARSPYVSEFEYVPQLHPSRNPDCPSRFVDRQRIHEDPENWDRPPIEIRAVLSRCSGFGRKTFGDDFHVRRKRRYDEEQDRGTITNDNCTRKILISMRFNNIGKTEIEEKFVVIDHALDSVTMRKIPLRDPYVIKVRQEAILQLYGLKFQSVVNAEAREEVINNRSPNYTGCDVDSERPTCGQTFIRGELVPFSQVNENPILVHTSRNGGRKGTCFVSRKNIEVSFYFENAHWGVLNYFQAEQKHAVNALAGRFKFFWCFFEKFSTLLPWHGLCIIFKCIHSFVCFVA
ncbi:Neprilysin [Melipona quadrifasciata]|uniref:Neprilysin n=1 Tax=Melipona quadrifasciata TaxID=166423 RepID=A0A0M8ZU84_9HYME|nr:Neprilysin [Melipona quadrifasciata]